MAGRIFNCKNNPNSFCFVCGKYVTGMTGRKIKDNIKLAYLHYFGFEMRHDDKPWTPNIVCAQCRQVLNKWMSGEKTHLQFGVPMLWREVVNHETDCYFCVVNVRGINRSALNTIVYPDVVSATKRVPHNENLPIPTPPTNFATLSSESERERDSSFFQSTSSSSDRELFHLVVRKELNDFIRDLELDKKKVSY